MFRLQVFCNGALHRMEAQSSADDVLARIAELLGQRDGCEKIVVTFDDTPLFAVDGEGNAVVLSGR